MLLQILLLQMLLQMLLLLSLLLRVEAFFQNSMVKNVMTGGTRALGAGLVMKAIRGKPPAPAPRPAPAPMMNPMMMRPPMMGPPMGGPPRMNPNMMAQQHAVAAAQARMPGPLTGQLAVNPMGGRPKGACCIQ